MKSQRTRRRRRTPEAARQEILEAAARLFGERPAHEVTVQTIMDATTLARSSFYDNFRRRGDLVMQLVAPLIEMNHAVIDQWPVAPPEPRLAARGVAEALVATWRTEEGRMLLALAEAARDDEDAAAAFQRFSDDSVAHVAARIRTEIERGSTSGIDPDETALAIVLMNRAYITAHLMSDDPAPDAVMAATLAEIWVRVIWPGR